MSVFYDILGAVQTAIRGLSLTGVSSSNVVLLKVAAEHKKDLPDTKYPAVLVAPSASATEKVLPGTNLRNDIVYPVTVWMVDNDNQSQSSNFDRDLIWRQKILRKFQSNISAFTSITTVFDSNTQPLTIVDAPAWSKGLWISGLIINVSSRESRVP